MFESKSLGMRKVLYCLYWLMFIVSMILLWWNLKHNIVW